MWHRNLFLTLFGLLIACSPAPEKFGAARCYTCSEAVRSAAKEPHQVAFEKLMDELSAWIVKTDPRLKPKADAAKVQVRFVPIGQLQVGVKRPGHEIIGRYHPNTRQPMIVLADEWRYTLEDVSILLHELVHAHQHLSGMAINTCSQEHERMAYRMELIYWSNHPTYPGVNRRTNYVKAVLKELHVIHPC